MMKHLFFCVLLGSTASAALADKKNLPASPPNIVLIMSDDMGISDLGCYGGEIQTPTLDRLGYEGLRFSQFYNCGRCCPTRASLLTGLYPHQAGVGHMLKDRGLKGYRGALNNRCVTIAEVLSTAGYSTYMAGKWHVAKGYREEKVNKQNWPLQRGFQRFYGTIHGAGSLWDPNTLTRDNRLISPLADPEYQPEETWYYTDAISDQAVRFIHEHRQEEPFFLYVSYTAAHWPMHARERDVAKYRARYDVGFQAIREARFRKMQQLGFVDNDCQLTPQSDSWDEVSNQTWEARNMEVYAAMVESMDRGIGRIVAELEQRSQLQNTLIFFLHDNGGCAENFGRGSEGSPRADQPTLPPMRRDELQLDMVPKQTRDGYPVRQGRGVMAGPADTFIGYGRGWANVSNTPFREYKHWVHEGGIATPLIVHWPARLNAKGEWRRTPAHLIDIMATCVDVSGADYPDIHRGEEIQPLEGASLLPVFDGRPIPRRTLYWEHERNCAVRHGNWKLVGKKVLENDGPVKDRWELYDLSTDRAELNNLASSRQDVVDQLHEMFSIYCTRTLVIPFEKDEKPL